MQTLVTRFLSKETGLTLIELVITVTILLTLISLGVPSFRNMTIKNQQRSEINSFVHHFHLARSLAITKETHHILCPSVDGETCLGTTDWSQGFILFEDRNRNKTKNQDERLQGSHHPGERVAINIHSSSGRKRVVYQGDGRPSGYNLTLTFCDPDNLVPPKAVIVNNEGRVRVSEVRPSGSPLSCSR
ncbi:MAG: GspH/FimT family pseudopilin [Candidatus Thiodiazotropha sp. (ex Ustalcina ferruginea)]|nr:GspH/FimT family pseudopilin [Candidatus Thiodiazotropha sp. (ex Ustalcina ferruginea)]